MSLPPSAMGARSRDPEPSEPHGPGPRVKICSWSCLSWLHPLRSWSLRQTRGGSVASVGCLFLRRVAVPQKRQLNNRERRDNYDGGNSPSSYLGFFVLDGHQRLSWRSLLSK